MRWFLFFLVVTIFWTTTAKAAPPNVDSPAFILAEQTTGRVLYSRNERERRYPANLTKMLTALIALEELEPDEVIVIGQEIRGMPTGFGSNVHFEGETISVQMLLGSMLIRGANEPARVLALNVIRRREGRFNIPFEQANAAFSALLSEKARSLGATGTNFSNAFGHTNENHFTTAYDLALITRAFMDNPILAEIAATRTFEGDSLFGAEYAQPNVREHSWTSANQMLPHGAHGHPYVIGAKAGFTSAAGHVLAGAAEFDGLQLVTVVLGGTDAMRWQDTRRLIDYGLRNFSFREIARTGDVLAEVLIENPRLGDDETLQIILGENTDGQPFYALLSHAEYASVRQTIIYDPTLPVIPEEDDETESTKTILRAPIEEGMQIGTARFAMGTEPFLILFEAPVFAAHAVYERTFDSDMDYHLAAFFGNVFSRRALPYYFGIFGTIFGIIGIIIAVRTSRRTGRSTGWTYSGDRRSRYNRY